MIGREDSDILVADGTLSRRHARLTLKDGVVFIEDLGSRNGTRVNGEAITRTAVQPGAEILLGAVAASIHEVLGRELPDLGLESDDAFFRRVEQEILRARTFGRQPAVMLVRAAATNQRLALWYPRVKEALRQVDSAGLYRPDILQILLPETTPEEAVRRASELTSDKDGQPQLLCGLACPAAGAAASDLIAAAFGALHEATVAQPIQVAASKGAWSAMRPSAGDQGGGTKFVTQNAAMEYVLQTAKRVAAKSVSVLIQGETGVGKEVVAQVIHEASPRCEGPFVTINCAAVTTTLIESTFFGHEKGAFTGATHMRKGPFEIADGGTLLLDEVGELSPEAQAALLRVLETSRVTRLGSTKEIEIDVRIIAATNRDLDAMSEAGTFRQDLLYRINKVPLQIPPLWQRPEDIEPLALHFLALANDANERDAKKRGTSTVRVQRIDGEASKLLSAYRWPGNARELRNVIERAVAICESDVITAQNLPERVIAGLGSRKALLGDQTRGSAGSDPQSGPTPPPNPEVVLGAGLEETLGRVEANLIIQALEQTEGSQVKAASLLGIAVRTLQNKIKQHSIRQRWEVKK